VSGIDVAHEIPPYAPAPAASPLALSSSSRTAMRVVLVVLAALVTLGTLSSLGALAFGVSSIRVVDTTQALPASVRSLTIDIRGVPVAVSVATDLGATQPRVDLRAVTTNDDTGLAVANDVAGSRVTLRDSVAGYMRWVHEAYIKVILPPGAARVLSMTVNQRTGSLSTDANLDQLVANIDYGAVTLGGSARRVDVNVRRGDIRTRTPIAVTESFKADTEYGGISVEFRVAPRTTEAIADDDVTVGLPVRGPYRVRAQSEARHGETTVTVPETSDPGAPEVMAHSKGAHVAVTELR
jgi:hypothetical protein